MNPEILRRMVELMDRRVPFAVATVVGARGSVPGKLGARMIVFPDGSQEGTVGGAGLEQKVKAMAQETIRTHQSTTHHFELARQKPGGLDSVCGGGVEVFVEYMAPRPHILIYGCGHVGEATARLCTQLDYSHSVADVRPDFATKKRFPHARNHFTLSAEEFFQQATLSDYSHILILGHDHHVDGEIALAALKADFPGSIGIIGSKTKRAEFQSRCKEQGVAPELFDEKVTCPIGLSIQAETPAEIAVAILAQIIEQYRTTTPKPQEE
jgi:xanthine dehydrogenase accessory factor